MTDTKTAATAGPWRALAGPSAYIRIVANQETIARLYRDDVPDWRQNEANAHLMKAAPDLLAALKLALADPEGLGILQGKAHWMIEARAAIAKAEEGI